jgi:hypothetical protein
MQAAIEETKVQLREVQELLLLEPNSPDLEAMTKDLRQLLELQEQEFLETRKKELLALLGDEQGRKEDVPKVTTDHGQKSHGITTTDAH